MRGFIEGTGPLALDTKPVRKNVYTLDKFKDEIQAKRFRQANSHWKEITIKKL